MKKKRGKQGQFIIFAVLIIATMIISIGVIMYSTVTYFKHERWNEYLSLIDNLKVSSRHLMEINLANFTKTSFEQRAPDRSAISQILNQWKNDLKIGLAGSGVAVDFLNTSQLLSSPKVVGETYIPERSVYNFIKCYWYYPVSISSFYADLLINLTNFGLYGYRYPILVSLSMELDISYLTDAPTQISELVVNVTCENGLPVTDLTAENFLIYKFDPLIEDWTTANLSTVKRILGGYRLVFENSIEQPYYKWLIVAVEDNRGIKAVSSTYTSIDFIVEKNTPTSGRPANTDDEIYTLEAGMKGQWYWNGEQLDFNGTVFPPIPSLPTKQFRVNATENGVDSEFVISPAQYEIWDEINWHDQVIEVPRDLADPYYFFNSTNRLVFQVKFPTLSVTHQRVKIWWTDDLDAEPYQGSSDLQYIPGAYLARTNRFEVEFIGVGHTQSPDYPYDYYGAAALLIKDPNTGLSFGPWNLHAFGTYDGSLGEWRPYGQWQVKYAYGGTETRAVVRLIALLNSSEVQCVYDVNHHSSSYYDTYAVVFINANVKYLQTSTYVFWKQNQTDNGLWFASVMGKGEPKWFAYLNNQTEGVYNDAYDYLPWWQDPTHEEYEYPGYWGAHWNEQIGRGLIINAKGLVNLKSLDANRARFSITEASPGGSKQGSIEFEAVNCDGSSYTVVENINYNYTWAMWMYDGGSQVDGFEEVQDYHGMFLEPYAPEIISSEGG